MMNDDFSYLMEKFGGLDDVEFLPRNRLQSLQGILPSALVEFWGEVGLGSWGDGVFRFCDPEMFQGLLNMILGSDPVLSAADCAVFGFSAFAELRAWHRVFGMVEIDLPFTTIQSHSEARSDVKETRRAIGEDRVIAVNLSDVVSDCDMRDRSGALMFNRATKRLGKLKRDECFGFVPALALGGSNELDQLRRVRALEHFQILAGLSNFSLIKYDIDGREVFVRTIGR